MVPNPDRKVQQAGSPKCWGGGVVGLAIDNRTGCLIVPDLW